MNNHYKIFLYIICLILLGSFTDTNNHTLREHNPYRNLIQGGGGFRVCIEEDAIRYQLDWAKANNFGGVDIAFVYPQLGAKPGPKWLSEEWSAKCKYAKQYADKIGLGCDFTFGTVWPFGGSIVSEQDAFKIFGGLSPQRMEKSWELSYETKPAYVLNHLDSNAFQRYADKVGGALKEALQGQTNTHILRFMGS